MGRIQLPEPYHLTYGAAHGSQTGLAHEASPAHTACSACIRLALHCGSIPVLLSQPVGPNKFDTPGLLYGRVPPGECCKSCPLEHFATRLDKRLENEL